MQQFPAASGALVIGGDYRGLGVVRSLGRRGIPVWVLTDEHRVAAASRYARRSLTWPAGEERDQVAFLQRLATEQHLAGWTIFPTGDETVALVARHAVSLSQFFLLPVSPWEISRWAYDKRLTHQLATEVGVDFPRTYYPACREDVAALDCAFPVILKPAVKQQSNAFTRVKAWRVDNAEQLLDRYDAACKLVDPDVVMVQEVIPGDGETQVSYAALCHAGMPLVSLTAKRIRQYPMDFGRFSTFVETAELPEVEVVARRLLAARGFTGLVEVEFKLDRRDGGYKLLDLNPRIWGWHTLGPRAGIDFPYLTWQMVHGEPIHEVSARPHTRWIRFLPDLSVVVPELLGGRMSLGAYLRSLRGPLEFAIFAADDPLPALVDFPFQVYRIGKHYSSSSNTRDAGPATVQRRESGVRSAKPW